MDTWVVCPKCMIAYEDKPGTPCIECGTSLQEAPLVMVRKPVEISRDSRTRKCPYCRVNNVLHTFPGGFKACFEKECVNAALDDAAEAEAHGSLA